MAVIACYESKTKLFISSEVPIFQIFSDDSGSADGQISDHQRSVMDDLVRLSLFSFRPPSSPTTPTSLGRQAIPFTLPSPITSRLPSPAYPYETSPPPVQTLTPLPPPT